MEINIGSKKIHLWWDGRLWVGQSRNDATVSMGIINREAFIESNKIVEYLLATKEMFGNKVWVFFVNDSRILDTFTMLQISLGGRCANISIKVSLFARTLKKKMFSPNQCKECTTMFREENTRFGRRFIHASVSLGIEI